MSIFVQSWEQFQQSLETADWSKKHTAKTLFDSPNWERMTFGSRIAIGRVLRFFVDNGWLPLRVANPKSSGTKRYELVEQSIQAGGDSFKGATSISNQPT